MSNPQKSDKTKRTNPDRKRNPHVHKTQKTILQYKQQQDKNTFSADYIVCRGGARKDIRINDVNQKRFLMTHQKEHGNEDVLKALQDTQHTISDESIAAKPVLAAIEGRSDTMSNLTEAPTCFGS